MRTDLKPCPFCGGKAITSIWSDRLIDEEGHTSAYTFFEIVCKECGAKVQEGMVDDYLRKVDTFESAIALMKKVTDNWNRRKGE